MDSYLIDTNVVLRASSAELAGHKIAADAVSKLVADNHEIVLASQVLVEFWVVATRPREVNGFGWTTGKTMIEIDRLTSQFSVLLDLPEIYQHWLDLVARLDIKGKRAHDARLAAVMAIHGVPNILTLNVADFNGLPIRAVSPHDVLAA